MGHYGCPMMNDEMKMMEDKMVTMMMMATSTSAIAAAGVTDQE